MLKNIPHDTAIRAFFVILFGATAAFLVLKGQPVPDMVQAIIFTIVGYYFGKEIGKRESD